jgi:hypothetical protein
MSDPAMTGLKGRPHTDPVSAADSGWLLALASLVAESTGQPARRLVVASRWSGGWRAETTQPSEVRWGRSLHAVDREVRNLLTTATADYQFHTGNADLDRLVAQVRTSRRAAHVLQAQAQQLTTQVLALPHDASRRDLAILLDLSHQRIDQLIHNTERSDWKGP